MDSVSSPLPSSSKPSRALRLVAALIAFTLFSGGVVWYVIRKKPRTVFHPETQIIPKGATSLEVNDTLASFKFSKPLPFFDERNVVQSLAVSQNASTLTVSSSTILKVPTLPSKDKTTIPPPPRQAPSIFLSYRISGQDKTAIRSAFIEYFKNMGWKMAIAKDTRGDQPLTFFLPQTRQHVLIAFADAAGVSGAEKPAVVAGLSMITFPVQR